MDGGVLERKSGAHTLSITAGTPIAQGKRPYVERRQCSSWPTSIQREKSSGSTLRLGWPVVANQDMK